MTLDKDQIASKIWNICTILWHDGVNSADYLEQITFLIFLKMAYEKTRAPYNQTSLVPDEYNWESLAKLDGNDLEIHYRDILDTLSKYEGMLGIIFRKAQNKISDPAKLKRVINEIGRIDWNILGVDVKGEIYESLLGRVAEDTKSGAGQYFTPRELIKAMVQVLKPTIHTTIHDPCCGTGGFLLEAHDHILHASNLDRDEQKMLKTQVISGQELVTSTARLAVMNMFLHGIGEAESPILVGDSLIKDPGTRFDIILTNPPFGKKSTDKFSTEDGLEGKNDNTIVREDFWTTTGNKQLNFLQHIHTLLKIGGRAAVVLPDNVLFEGGSGEVVRKKLLHNCNLHTILRLPTGIFYANGVKANVLFFEKKQASENPWTRDVWFYDLRTNNHFSLKQNSLKIEDLQEFIECYHPENIHDRKETYSVENPEGKWRKYTLEEIQKRDKINLDIFWIKDKALEESENLPSPEIIAREIMDDLENALEQFRLIEKDLNT
ncbi:MAG: class I SAM-dependent DNA methyltransferase [Candidatus Gracilibacteria bacterium]|nr:class I SAM-dependent DNA methyltransferase [Candidatus Gracilibacteria bacterium]